MNWLLIGCKIHQQCSRTTRLHHTIAHCTHSTTRRLYLTLSLISPTLTLNPKWSTTFRPPVLAITVSVTLRPRYKSTALHPVSIQTVKTAQNRLAYSLPILSTSLLQGNRQHHETIQWLKSRSHYTVMSVLCDCCIFRLLQHMKLPSVLWCCWLGDRKGIRPVKNKVVGYFVFYRPDTLPVTQPTASKHWRQFHMLQ